MNNIEIIGIIAGLFTTGAPIPQIIKIIKTKSASDISLWMLAILILGLILWLTYGLFMNAFALVLWNIVALMLNVLVIILWFKYR